MSLCTDSQPVYTHMHIHHTHHTHVHTHGCMHMPPHTHNHFLNVLIQNKSVFIAFHSAGSTVAPWEELQAGWQKRWVQNLKVSVTSWFSHLWIASHLLWKLSNIFKVLICWLFLEISSNAIFQSDILSELANSYFFIQYKSHTATEHVCFKVLSLLVTGKSCSWNGVGQTYKSEYQYKFTYFFFPQSMYFTCCFTCHLVLPTAV